MDIFTALDQRRAQLNLSVDEVQLALRHAGYDVTAARLEGWFAGPVPRWTPAELLALLRVLHIDLRAITVGDKSVQDGEKDTLPAPLSLEQQDVVLSTLRGYMRPRE